MSGARCSRNTEQRALLSGSSCSSRQQLVLVTIDTARCEVEPQVGIGRFVVDTRTAPLPLMNSLQLQTQDHSLHTYDPGLRCDYPGGAQSCHWAHPLADEAGRSS